MQRVQETGVVPSAPRAVRSTPFGLYCAVALVAGILGGLLLIDYVTRPDVLEDGEPAYEVTSGAPAPRAF